MIRRYDLQVHTDASPCSSTPPERVATAAADAGLDGIAVTDHDTLANVDAVRDATPESVDVISGVEVTTTEGHLLALDVTEPPPQADPLTVVDHVHEQGGIAILSHPFDSMRQSYEMNLDALAEAIDGVEAVNSRCVRRRFNERAAAFAADHVLPATGGSDAHFSMEVGRAYTRVEGDGSLADAVHDGRVQPVGRGRYFSGHVATKVHQFRTASGRIVATLSPGGSP
ncbi:PHP-associated domain-containing protein [Natrialba asiatica]|uniref:PHP domain-containing protein n=1 Tax=Natrialba asiatica (strain ATCC 700177 / DSM 12278 / JCM 9576 / FERM P-10747 / NBRC 102637 / 172P1) TaxID=29540 RepID=M0B3A6_NATA1|nr:PHP domain-containing protein [Natrialba asiatica]ELZ05285.1 PHP domain-containing protein [Natrialba asiatica DSM 12278]